jgi:hypothetical protein
MPIAATLLAALDFFCIVHAVRSGRYWPWSAVIFFVPGFGALAYIYFEIVPEWRRSRQGQQAIRGVKRAINPEGEYRRLKDELEVADTIANRHNLALECERLGRYDEAIGLYDEIIAAPMGHEPKYHQERASLLLDAGRPIEALAALDALRKAWPDYQSQDAHLIYARALVASDRLDEAEAEYRGLIKYFAGPEPGLDLARLLARQGRAGEARALAADYVKRIERAPRFTRDLHREALRDLRAIARG